MEKKEIVQCVENSIKKLIKVFCEKPYLFYTENDIHCFLYRLLYDEMDGKSEWKTTINDKEFSTLPFHKEYPTREYYIKKEKSNDDEGTRGHFDIVVFHETKDFFEFKNRKLNSEPSKPFIAIQIGLDTATVCKHLESDYKSLIEPENDVDYKYLLHFDRKKHKKNTIEDIKKKVNDCKKNIQDKGGICYIDVSEHPKCKILASNNLSVDYPNSVCIA